MKSPTINGYLKLDEEVSHPTKEEKKIQLLDDIHDEMSANLGFVSEQLDLLYSARLNELEEMPNINWTISELQTRIEEIDASKERLDLDFPKQEKKEEQAA